MSLKTLPQELIDHIIDDIDPDDFALLSVVSRIAQSWRPRSQPRIWRKVILSGTERLELLKTLLSHSPHLAPYIQTLLIDKCDLVDYIEICTRFINVSDLTLTNYWDMFSEQILSPLGDFLSSLSSLSSLSLRIGRLSEHILQVLFDSCASLTAISFERCLEPIISTDLPFTSLTAPRSLQSIACDGRSAIIESLATCTYAPGFPTHLRLGPGNRYRGQQVQLLNAMKDQLESVEILGILHWRENAGQLHEHIASANLFLTRITQQTQSASSHAVASRSSPFTSDRQDFISPSSFRLACPPSVSYVSSSTHTMTSYLSTIFYLKGHGG